MGINPIRNTSIMPYTPPTWLHLLDEWVTLFISEGVNLEQLVRVTVVEGPVEQVHLAAAAPRINHYSEVVGGEVSAGCMCVGGGYISSCMLNMHINK